MGSEAGLSDENILALTDYRTSPHYDEQERIALAYADAIAFTDRDVDDTLFAQLQQQFSDDAIVELTAIIAWENSSSKFNRALRVPSQGLWQRSGSQQR